ncbi:MAG: adenosine kinase [Gammaproteobacteria bacterium]|nr:adenosine kinase [Gammaproteobacteria bacterium]
MTKFHVYGVGNALVDIEYRISLDDLRALGLTKGSRCLIDQSECEALITALVDSPCRRISGGSVANSLVAIAQLGGSAYFAGTVAADEAGYFYLQDLATHGVVAVDTPVLKGATGECFVFVTPDADRTLRTFLGVSGDLTFGKQDHKRIAESNYVFLEGYLASTETSCAVALATLEAAVAAGVKTALSLSDISVIESHKRGLEALLYRSVNVLFANENEALHMTNATHLSSALLGLQQLASCFCITRGGQGVLIFDGERYIDIPAKKVTAVDTNGAGDMFAGAFLYALTQGMTVEQAGELAVKSSAKVVSAYGPRLNATELKRLSRER